MDRRVGEAHALEVAECDVARRRYELGVLDVEVAQVCVQCV